MPMSRRAVLGALVALPAAALARPRAGVAASIVRVDDPEMAAIVRPDAAWRTLYEGGLWCEGVCWAPALGGLVFSDVKRNRMAVVGEDGAVRPFRDPSNNANGNVLDAQGRLVTCEHRGRRVVRQEADGTLTVLAERFEGRRLNSPNDAALAPDGAIWFTDPVYGITQPDEGIVAEPEQAARRVYRIDPASGALEAMIEEIDQPNGLVFSPDGRTLYVSESGGGPNPEGGRAVMAFAVEDARRVGPGRVFAALDAGVPDGLAVDRDGRLYVAAQDGIRIHAADGRRLGRLATATATGNLAFGGPDGRRLFVAEGERVLALDLDVAGLAIETR